jgi:hypothetical protein
MGDAVRIKEGSIAKGLKFQRLQRLDDGRIRRFAYDSS